MPSPDRDVSQKYWRAFRGLWRLFTERDLGLIAAGVAFFFLLSVFPIFAAFVSIWGFFADPAAVTEQVQALEGLVPESAIEVLARLGQGVTFASQDTLGWATIVSVIAASIPARAGAGALMGGLNMVYRERARRGIWQFLTGIGMTVGVMVALFIALCLVIGVPVLLNFLPLGDWATVAVRFAKWCVMAAVILVGLGLVYRIGPNRRAAQTPWLSPGAIFAAVLWLGLSFLFSLYLDNFGRFNEAYGSIGAIIGLMLWLYVSAVAVLAGAGLNAELELRTQFDTTIGPDRPIGQRGAYVADTFIDPKHE